MKGFVMILFMFFLVFSGLLVFTSTRKVEAKKPFCVQQVVCAVNPSKGKYKMFTTPCKVPTEWEIVEDSFCM
jgi:hypothetical protein